VECWEFIKEDNLVNSFIYLTQPSIGAHFLVHLNDLYEALSKQMIAQEAEVG